jgi:cyclophilin family peptidyl-prolyl cis-trans isomerase
MYTGAYSVATEEDDEDGLVQKDYYDFVKNSSDYGNFPHSVWRDEEKTIPLYTLYGEFESNKVTVENGALKENFDTLTMYYNTKTTIERVYGKRVDSDNGEVSKREYKYNSATSMFYISMVTTETATSDYCTFAKLDEDSVSVLEDLQAAINAYVGEEEGDEFTSAHTVRVDEDDIIVGETVKEVKFDVPNSPIVIKSVKVTKY